MKQNKITSLQYSILIFFLINSFLMNVGFNLLTTISFNDSIFDILIGGIFIILLLFIINKIRNNKSIISIINSMFLPIKIFTYIILICFIGISLVYSVQVLTSFIHYYILKEVDYFFISITVVSTSLYIVSKGITTISKTSEIFLFIYVLIMIIGFIGVSKYIDLSNLKPFFISDFKSHYQASSIYFFSAITPLFLLLLIPKEQIENNKYNRFLPYIFTFISIILSFFLLMMIISVLGIGLTNIYENPDMILYKKISFLNILERVEVLLSFANLLNSLVFIVMASLFVKEMVGQLISNKKEHIILALIGIIVLILVNVFIIDKMYYFVVASFILLFIIFLFIKTIIDKHNY